MGHTHVSLAAVTNETPKFSGKYLLPFYYISYFCEIKNNNNNNNVFLYSSKYNIF